MLPTPETTFEPTWAVVELMGHVRMAGLLGEQSIAGDKLVRLDIPALPEETRSAHNPYHPVTGAGKFNHEYRYDVILGAVPGEVKFIGVKSIYMLSPCSEETARAEVARMAGRSKRYENVIEVSTVQQIAAAAEDFMPADAGAPAEETQYTCEAETCFNQATYSGDSKAECDAVARANGWSVPDKELGEDDIVECPECYARSF